MDHALLHMIFRLVVQMGNIHMILISNICVSVISTNLHHRVLKMSDYRTGTVRAIAVQVCTVCEEHIQKCSDCGKWFDTGDVVQCRSGIRHVCKDCM